MTRVPWILYRLIARELVLTFALSLVGLSLLYTIISGLQGVSYGLPMSIVLSFVFESIGYSFFFTVPVSLLLAAGLCYGRMVAEREYTAITASGLSPLHLLVPLLALSLLCTGAAWATHGVVLPDSHYARRNIARFLVRQLEELGDRKQGQLPIDSADGRVYYDEVRGGTHMKGVHIVKTIDLRNVDASDLQHAAGTNGAGNSDSAAGGADIPDRPLQFILESNYADIEIDEERQTILLQLDGVDARVADPDSEMLFERYGWPKHWQAFQVDRYTVEIPLSEQNRRRRDLHNGELMERREKARAEIERLERQLPAAGAEEREEIVNGLQFQCRQYRLCNSEYWQRKALVLSFLSFPLLGYPISLLLRYRHRLVGLFIAFMIVVLIFYPLLFLAETLSTKPGFPAPITMLSGNMTLLLVSTFLCGRLLFR